MVYCVVIFILTIIFLFFLFPMFITYHIIGTNISYKYFKIILGLFQSFFSGLFGKLHPVQICVIQACPL